MKANNDLLISHCTFRSLTTLAERNLRWILFVEFPFRLSRMRDQSMMFSYTFLRLQMQWQFLNLQLSTAAHRWAQSPPKKGWKFFWGKFYNLIPPAFVVFRSMIPNYFHFPKKKKKSTPTESERTKNHCAISHADKITLKQQTNGKKIEIIFPSIAMWSVLFCDRFFTTRNPKKEKKSFFYDLGWKGEEARPRKAVKKSFSIEQEICKIYKYKSAHKVTVKHVKDTYTRTDTLSLSHKNHFYSAWKFNFKLIRI